MALFGLGKQKTANDAPVVPAEKKEEKTTKAAVASPKAPRSSGGGSDLSHVLKNPRITEKATAHGETGIYAFDVAANATKRSVAEAVHAVYSVRPRMVRIVPIPTKVRRSLRTGRSGVTKRGKKAYVYLNKGETITIT